MNFEEILEEKIEETDRRIRKYLPREDGFSGKLAQAMNYAMSSGGKRLRPLILQESYAMFGGSGQEAEVFMAALEMIHTHSLIHDDLPALDNDQLAAPEWYLRKCRPRLGTDFLLTARGLLTDDIRRDLKRLGDFTFRQHPRIRAEQERLDSLSKIVQNQIHQILST